MQKKVLKLITGLLFLLAAVLMGNQANAQNTSDLRFNEILVYNDSNYVDDFGNHSPWFEIFNTSYNSINIGGCYLTNDPANPTKYWIPTGSPATLIPPRCYIVFWADNHPTRGIFHLNFSLENSKVIALYDAGGRTLIDKVEITQPQKADVSFGKATVDTEEWSFLEHSTPGADNDYSKKVSAGETFKQMDPFGLAMAIIAMTVVFLSLALLYIIYKNLGRYFVRKTSGVIKHKEVGLPATLKKTEEIISGELNAAIAMTLYLYQTDLHDHENTVLTIQKVSRNYSPWSSKIYTLRRIPK